MIVIRHAYYDPRQMLIICECGFAVFVRSKQSSVILQCAS